MDKIERLRHLTIIEKEQNFYQGHFMLKGIFAYVVKTQFFDNEKNNYSPNLPIGIGLSICR
jgi:hypothetical protein